MEHQFEFGKNSEKGYWQQCTVCEERKYVHISVYLDPVAAGWTEECPGPPTSDPE